jgi:hypothetical protein
MSTRLCRPVTAAMSIELDRPTKILLAAQSYLAIRKGNLRTFGTRLATSETLAPLISG